MTKSKLLTPGQILANVERRHKWIGDVLKLYAEQLLLVPTKEEETMRVDMSTRFLKEIRRRILNKELVNVQVNAQVRMGKSTLAILIAQYIYDLLRRYKLRQADIEFGIDNIARDDQEYSKKMRNPELMFNVIMTDEYNALEATGENVTTEAAQKKVFSDVQAGRYVHKVSCSPIEMIDENADIRLEVRNRQKGLTHSRLYYKLVQAGTVQWVLLGYVDLDVSVLITNWMKVEKRFMQYIKNKNTPGTDEKELERDRKFVDYWCKKDFYIEYMTKKYQKMELMNKEGILRPRELDYAAMNLLILEKTKNLVEIMSVTQLKLIVESYVNTESRKMKIPLSILGVELAARRVMSILSSYKTKVEICDKIRKIHSLHLKGKVTQEECDRQSKMLKKTLFDIDEIIFTQQDELRRYKEVNEEYNAHIK